jgi:hypothetical protein
MRNLVFSTFLFFLSLASCQNADRDSSNSFANTVSFNRDEINMKVNDSTRVLYTRKLSEFHPLSYTVSINPPFRVIKKDLNIINDSPLLIVGEKEGKGMIYLKSENIVVDSVTIYVGKENQIKVLAIGNSFSEDALENPYIQNLFKANNKDILIGNAHISGASFSTHLNSLNQNASNYSYRKVRVNSERSIYENVQLAKIINDEDWDYISFQQASPDSGLPETFQYNLPNLYHLVINLNNNKSTKYILHQTWAYSPTSTHPGFKNYNYNQLTMYNAILSTYANALNLVPISQVVPSGTAIQNARTSVLGNDLTRDGYHLSWGVGRFVVACTWYESLTGHNVTNNSYTSNLLSAKETQLAKKAAHFANLKPFNITNLE